MAEYHFHLEVIRRSVGHPGAVYQAAYNARAKVRDHRLGRTFDFSRQDDLVHEEILAPDGAPPWAFDREQLWNRAEAAERQYNGQPGRYFDIGLPVELSPEARLQLVREFVKEEFVDRGMIADFAIHDGDGTNPHFHLLVTMRELDGNRFSTRKQRAWNDRSLLLHWREAWELFGNRALAREGHDARIDHRSYAARGINLAPQPKLFRNPREIAQDGRDHVHERSDTLETRREANGDRILRDPTIPLRLLTSRRSTFSERELVRVVNRLTIDAQRAHVMAAVKACSELVRLPRPDEQGETLYSTKSVVARERAILNTAHVLARRRGHRVEERYVEQAIASAPRALSDEQRAALRHLAKSGDLALVQGFAGAGKTTMLHAAHVAWQGQGLTVVGGALIGRAAEQLEQETGIPSRTLKSWEHSWEGGYARLTPRHVLVLDEAAMVGTAQFQKLIDHVRKAGAKLVLVGDIGQLQPIEIGAPMRLLQERYEAAKLQTVHRQRAHAWQRQATERFATGRADEALGLYLREGRVHAHASATDAHHAIIRSWTRDHFSAPREDTLMLAFRRKDVRALNELARAERKKAGELGLDHQLRTDRGIRRFAAGDRLLFLRNHKPLGVKNGTLGTIEHIADGKLVVRLDGTQRKIIVDTRHYAALDHGYATTVHKSQGATVDRVYVFASRYMDASATYVALSRHRTDVEVHYSRTDFRDADRLVRVLARKRVHRMAHDVLEPITAPRAPEAILDAVLRAPPAVLERELELLIPITQERTVTPAEIVARLPATRALEGAERDARTELAAAIGALDRFQLARPRDVERRTAAYRALEASLEEARARHIDARLRFERALRDPDLLKQARRIASQHNLRIARAFARVREIRSSQREAHKQDLLFGISRAANVQARALLFRPAQPLDHGRRFDVVGERTEAGTRLYELRAHDGGPRVLAYAEDCTRAPDGHALFRGPTLNVSPNRTLQHAHDLHHRR